MKRSIAKATKEAEKCVQFLRQRTQWIVNIYNPHVGKWETSPLMPYWEALATRRKAIEELTQYFRDN